MIPTAQNVCGPLCGYTIEELRAESIWAPGRDQVGNGSRFQSGFVAPGPACATPPITLRPGTLSLLVYTDHSHPTSTPKSVSLFSWGYAVPCRHRIVFHISSLPCT